MTWRRIDGRLRTQNPAKVLPGGRVYGLNGDRWPRLYLSVWRTPDGVRVSCTRKEGPGRWWSEVDIPEEVFADLPELYSQLPVTS